MVAGIVVDRRREDGPRLARIRIDAEDQEFNGDGAKIDGSVHQRLRRVVGPNLLLAGMGADIFGARHGGEIHPFFDFILHRLEGDDAGLAHGRRDVSRDMKAIVAVAPDIKMRLEPRQRRNGGGTRQFGLDRCIGGEIEPQTGFGHVLETDRYTPDLHRFAHGQTPAEWPYIAVTGAKSSAARWIPARHDRAIEPTDSPAALPKRQNRAAVGARERIAI